MAKDCKMTGLDTYGLNEDFVVCDMDDFYKETDDGSIIIDTLGFWLEENWEAICHRDCKYFDLSCVELSVYHTDKGVVKGLVIDGTVSDDDTFFISNQRDADDWDEHSFDFEENLDDAFVPKEDIIGKKLIDIVELIIDAIQNEYDRLYEVAEERAMEDHHHRMLYGNDDW